MADSTKVLIIGSGVAGSLVATSLLSRGWGPVTMLEAGPPVRMRDPRLWLDFVTTGIAPYDLLYDNPDDFTWSGDPEQPWAIHESRVIGRGGSTLHWGGWCPRFMPEDFALYSNAKQGIDWPFGYDDLEPYYCRAEEYLQVAGDSSYPGRDWRSRPYPLEVAPYPLTACPIVPVMDMLKFSYQHMPVARNTVSINGKPQCVTHNTCNYCPIGARFTGDQPLDALERSPAFTLITSAPAMQLQMASKSRVAGVQYVDMTTGMEKTIEAEWIFVCAGALETPKLLLASQNAYWPNGVGNDNDLVGRYLVANPYLYSRYYSLSNPQRLQQELDFPTLCSREWDSEQQQAEGKFLMNMAHTAPDLIPEQSIYSGETADQIQADVTGQVFYELQGALAPFPSYNNRVTLASGTTRFGLQRTSIITPDPLYSDSNVQTYLNFMSEILHTMGFTSVNDGAGVYHQRGDHASSTCRMANTDVDGVVAPNLQVFGTDNLFIASNAVLPTLPAANPTLTLVAVIMRAMDQFVGKMGLDPSNAAP